MQWGGCDRPASFQSRSQLQAWSLTEALAHSGVPIADARRDQGTCVPACTAPVPGGVFGSATEVRRSGDALWEQPASRDNCGQ